MVGAFLLADNRRNSSQRRTAAVDAIFARMAENFDERITGPFHLRFIIQPAVAAFFAVMDGRRDARRGQTPYGWLLFTAPGQRRDLVRDGWQSIGKVFLAAVLIDIAFQLFVLHVFFPGGALLVGFLLAILPYVVLRGLAARMTARLMSRRPPPASLNG